jgi:hypothetical protein
MLEVFREVREMSCEEIPRLHSLAGKYFRTKAPRAAFVVSLESNYGNRHEFLIVVPRWYPTVAPAAYSLSHIPGQYNIAHIYAQDGRCCLFEKYGRDWNANECDLVTFVGWTAMWLFCQEFYQRKGYWPARESHKTERRMRSKIYSRKKR